MKDLKISGSGEEINDLQYNQFISDFDLKLPNLYKEIILKNNGGYPNLDSYGIPSEGGIRVSSWNRISLIDESYIESRNKVYSSREAIIDFQIDDEIIPRNLYPFALNEGGNHLCIEMNNNFKVYMYYTDAIDKNLRLISESFEEFIEALHEE